MKPSITLSLLVFFTLSIHAQAPEWAWAKGAKFGLVTAVTSDKNGNVFITGDFSDATIVFDNTTLTNTTNNDDADIFIVKYDPSGNLLWARSAGGTLSDVGSGISADADGNVYVCGTFDSDTINFGGIIVHQLNYKTDNDNMFVAKYDANGNVLWVNNGGGGNSGNSALGVSTDGDGNVIACGQFNGSITIGSNNLTADGFGFFLAKYDSTGAALWAQTAAGYVQMWGAAVTTDKYNNAYITGRFIGATGGNPTDEIQFGNNVTLSFQNNNINYFVAKYDSTGTAQWAQWADNASGAGLSTDGQGNLYVAGFFAGDSVTLGDLNLNNITNGTGTNGFVAKYFNDGTIITAMNINGVGENQLSGISSDAAGNFYITGEFDGASLIFAGETFVNPHNDVTSSNHESFLARYDAAANEIWARAFDDSTSLSSVYLDVNDNLYLTGYYDAPNIQFGSTTLQNTPPAFSMFTAKAGGISTGLPGGPVNANNIAVFPNPSGGQFYFNGLTNGSTIQIYNVLGAIIYSSIAISGNELISLNNNAKGIYFYKVSDNQMVTGNGKLIIE